jgi:hypothetical protein
MPGKLAAVIQMTSTANKVKNLATAKRLIGEFNRISSINNHFERMSLQSKSLPFLEHLFARTVLQLYKTLY